MTADNTAVVLPTTNNVSAITATPMVLLEMAVNGNADMAKLEALMAMQERWENREAHKAFVKAMSGFRSETISVIKDKEVKYKTQKGMTNYRHASLAAVIDAAQGAMAKHGLSHGWKTEQNPDGSITVRCELTHELGHTETTSLTASPDQSGNKNGIQAIGSTVSYLERYTFMSLTGLAAKDMDDDGLASSAPTYQHISQEQIDELLALIQETDTSIEGYLAWARVEKLADIATTYFDTCKKMLLRKKAEQEKEATK